MKAVDDYFRQNGKSFFSTTLSDSEFDRMARTRSFKRSRKEDLSDLMGRKYAAEENAWPIYTTQSQQIAEDDGR